MLCVPMLALIDPAYVPAPMLVAMLSLSMVMAASERQAVAAAEFRFLLPGLLLGTALGAAVLRAISTGQLGLVLGILVLLATIVSAAGLSARLNPVNLVIGATGAGMMGTVSGIHGPPLAVLYASQTPQKARATIAWIFVIGCVMSLTALHFAGLFSGPELTRGLWLIPGTLSGFFVARLVRERLPAVVVRTAMLWLTGIGATALIVKSLWPS